MQRAGALEYETSGTGDAVLCIHGAIVADSFAPLVPEPALADYRLIRYRRRGYGQSAPPAAQPTIQEQADDASSLLTHLGVNEAHVVAHSGGGPIAVQLALDAPTTVRSLVLLEPALQNAAIAAAFAEMIQPLIDMHLAGDRAKAVHLWMRTTAGGSDWRSAIEARIPDAGEHAIEDAAGTFEYDLAAMREWDFEAVGAEGINQPVLYVVGEQSAAINQPAVDMFLAAVPDTTRVVIPDCDHSLQMTHPAALARVIAEFLSRDPLADKRNAP
jgi:pimeloyl-ACP methyl ester carboxylesterase